MREKLTLGIYAAVLIALTVFVVTGYNSLADAPEDTVSDSGLTYSSFFSASEDKVVDLNITLPQDDWINMLVDAGNRQFYGANIEIDGTSYESVGLRIKSDIQSANPQSQMRHSFKIKFNKYISGQSFYGLDELNLINHFGDASFMREYLSLEVMRDLGIAAPVAVYINLYINGQPYGLYLGVEAIDDSFLTRHFGDALGNLYEAEKNATLMTDMHFAAFSRKKGEDMANDEITRLAEALNNMRLGEKGSIESILDVDGALRYIAANAVLGNYGSYLGENAQDYYLYQNNGIFTIMPSDTSTSFGAYKDDNGTSVDISTAKPLLNVTLTRRPLVEKLLAVQEYKTRYDEYVEAASEHLKGIESRIKELDGVISEYVEADPTKFYTFEHYKANINGTGNVSILTYIMQRLEFLTK